MSQVLVQQEGPLQERMRAADRRFTDLFNRGDVAGAARSIYTADAKILPPGAPAVTGRDAIVQFWVAAAAQLGIREVSLETVEAQPVPGGAYQVGRAVLQLAGGQSVEGKYVVIWKEEGGDLRWHIDIWNLNA